MLSIRQHFRLLLLLTAILWLVTKLFCVEHSEQVIPHPQFTFLSASDTIIDLIKADDQFPQGSKPTPSWVKKASVWYNVFFVVDFIWAPLLLLFLFRLVRDGKRRQEWSIQTWIMLLLSGLAWLFDVLENINYLLIYHSHQELGSLATWVKLKTGAYALVLFIFLLFLYQKFIQPNSEVIRKSITATRFSILIILVLFILCTKMGQGSTVIIHLLDHPLNCLVAIFMINVLAFACAHYPSYLEMKNVNVHWEMWPLWMRDSIGLGLINYVFPHAPMPAVSQSTKQTILNTAKIPQRQQTPHIFSAGNFFEHFRKAIGGLFFITWLYVLLFIYKKYITPDLPVFLLIVLYTLLFSLVYYICDKAKKEWQLYFATCEADFLRANNHASARERSRLLNELMPLKIKAFLYYTLYSFIFLLLSVLLTCWQAHNGNWEVTGFFFVITSVFSLFFYILFQNFRRVFSYFIPPWYLRWTGVHHMNNDVIYIAMFSLCGYICLFAVLGTLYDPTRVNAMVYILMFLYLYYGFFINLFKHNIYYAKNNIPVQNKWINVLSKFFVTYVPLVPALIVLWAIFSAQAGNGLHRLSPVAETMELITVDSFIQDFESHLDTGSQRLPVYYVASYGGGLRASAWTMLLLDKLNQDEQLSFFDRTIAMSGVSGGFIGLALYNAIQQEYGDRSLHAERIEKIGKENILAIELSYVMGYDLIREGIPYAQHLGPDRDRIAMNTYASLVTSRTDLLNDSYRNYWTKGYKSASNRLVPVLIGNTTGTHGRPGIAFPLQTNRLEFDTIFPGAIDILSFGDTTSIRYLDAASSTERFPVFSPAAEIKNKGYFLDGGYYENSGLLSLEYFKEYCDSLFDDSVLSRMHPKFVLIINSKESYVRTVLGDSVITKDQLATGELGAILKTVANIDILPLSLEQRLKNKYGNDFIPVYLPYKFTMADVINIIRGEPADPVWVQNRININNDKINRTWRIGVHQQKHMVEPALARVLSDPAFEYMKAMLEHPDVKAAIQKISKQ
jgi:hypothetical protein